MKEVNPIRAELFKPFCILLLWPHLVISFTLIQNQKSCRKESALQEWIPKKLAMLRQCKRSQTFAGL